MSTGRLSEFYRSASWKHFSESIRRSRHYICNRCGQPANVVHHIHELNERNVSDPDIALNPENMELLCRQCHEKHHDRAQKKPRRIILFDKLGNVIGVENT